MTIKAIIFFIANFLFSHYSCRYETVLFTNEIKDEAFSHFGFFVFFSYFYTLG
jgi:hypothetical protein